MGSDLRECLNGHELTAFTREDFDVRDQPAALEHLTRIRPDVIVNTTAFHQVDLCESRADDAFAVNTVAVYGLAAIANRLGAKLVHISTDYVLSGDGSRPLSEDDAPCPVNVYAQSKLAGEYVVRNVADRHLLIRTSGLYGAAGGAGRGGNFVETMIRKAGNGEHARIVDDQIVSPTWTGDLAPQIASMLDNDLEGLFHASAEGSCSWYAFATTVASLCGLAASFTATTSRAYGSPAPRPAYSVLENARLERLGLNRMLDWRDGLARYLQVRHGIAPGAPHP